MHINVPPSVTLDSSAPPTSLDVASTVSSPLSSLDDSPLGFSQESFPVITSEDLPIHTAESPPAVCPMCKQPVDQSYLEAFTKVGTRMSLRQQSQFCKAHKEGSAESEWAERGYPSIDWQQLDNRITGFHTSVDDILSRRNFSFYRNAFEDSLKGGTNKTIQESLMADEIEGTSPGYYGGRGAKVMYGSCFLLTPTSYWSTTSKDHTSFYRLLTFSGRTTSCPGSPANFADWQLQTSSSHLVESLDTCKQSWSQSWPRSSSKTI